MLSLVCTDGEHLASAQWCMRRLHLYGDIRSFVHACILGKPSLSSAPELLIPKEFFGSGACCC